MAAENMNLVTRAFNFNLTVLYVPSPWLELLVIEENAKKIVTLLDQDSLRTLNKLVWSPGSNQAIVVFTDFGNWQFPFGRLLTINNIFVLMEQSYPSLKVLQRINRCRLAGIIGVVFRLNFSFPSLRRNDKVLVWVRLWIAFLLRVEV